MTRDRYRKIILALLTINTVACVCYLKTSAEKPGPQHAITPPRVYDAVHIQVTAVRDAHEQCSAGIESILDPEYAPKSDSEVTDKVIKLRRLAEALVKECRTLEVQCRNIDQSKGMLILAIDAKSHAMRFRAMIDGMLLGTVTRDAVGLYTAHKELDEIEARCLILNTSVKYLKRESVDVQSR